MVFEPRATTSIASAALALPCTPSLRGGTLSTLRAFPPPQVLPQSAANLAAEMQMWPQMQLCLLLVAASGTPASGLVVLVAPSFANVRGTGGGGCGGWGGGAPTSASQQNLCNLARTCRPTQMCPVLPGGCSTRPAVAAQCGNSAGIRTWFQRGGAALQSGFGEAAERIRRETQEREV